MRLLVALLAVWFTAQAQAQPSQPAKMIIVSDNSTVAVTDYPSLARCEAARSALKRIVEAENEGKEPQLLPGGGIIISERLNLTAYCIPG